MLNLVKSSLEIGLEKPVKLLHATDTHICDLDERDDERRWHILRNDDVQKTRQNLRETIDYANEHCDMLVHTGDLYSLISPRSMEVSREFLDTCNNYLYIAGNHEFSRYGGEAWEDTAYKMTNYQSVRRILREDILFSSKEVGGVNIVGIDNGYYQVEKWQLWRLQQEVKKGLPIVLAMHVPLFEQSLYERSIEQAIVEVHYTCAHLMGCDEEHLQFYHNEFREVQQRPTDDTLRFIDYVYSEPLIKCALTGHIHFHYESTLPGGIVQYVTAKNMDGGVRELTLY